MVHDILLKYFVIILSFLGSFLVSQLIRLSGTGVDKVFSVDIIDPSRTLEELHNGETGRLRCDIMDEIATATLLQEINPTTVFHTASVVDLRQYPDPVISRVNINGTLNILNGMRALPNTKTRFMVYTSSIDVVSGPYGIANANAASDYAVAPSNEYKRTKILAERMVLGANCPTLCTCALRPGHIFGPADPVLPLASKAPLAVGSKAAKMSFVYVENCAAAHIQTAKVMVKESDLANQHQQQQKTSDMGDDGTTETTEVSAAPAPPNGVIGQAMFICDFEHNFCDMYKELIGANSSALRVPAVVLFLVVFFAQLLESVCYLVCGWRVLHPVTGMNSAVLESCYHLTADAATARTLIGYQPCDNKGTCFPLVNRSTSVMRTLYWVQHGALYPSNEGAPLSN